MATSRLIRRFAGSTSGSIAVESALLIFVFFFVLLIFKEAIFTVQIEGATHRAAAAAADVIANQRVTEGSTVQDALQDIDGEALNKMFREMVAGDASEAPEALQTGLTVTYFSTSDDTSAETLYTYGDLVCPAPSGQSLASLGAPGASGSLVTGANHGRLKLVRVDGCAALVNAASIGSLVFPRSFSSSFIAVRREE